MAILRIRTFGDPVLREKCAEVTTIDEKSVKLVKDLVETLYHVSGLGLAANQVGVVERLFVYDVGEGPVACFNPEVAYVSEEVEEEEEGCLSLPNLQIPISRPSVVELEFTDLKGKRQRVRGEGLLARLFMHETDHLDGSLLLDRASRENRAAAMKILNEDLRE